ncbi:MAG: hypothetical protein K5894_06530 [Lachnospiraceae bacterium]|nr:hypothetical protein [Lachnospiraceae bacterium]
MALYNVNGEEIEEAGNENFVKHIIKATVFSDLFYNPKVIHQTDSMDILNQYILFSKIYNEQRRLHGRSKETILKTISICKDRNILKEYLESREKEVVDIMMTSLLTLISF